MNVDPAILLGLRPRMMSFAYRMLGTVTDAEDAVQDAFVRLQTAEDVSSPEGFLIRTTTRLCIDRLRADRRRKEYVGPWVPEPVDTGSAARDAARAESLTQAFLLMLERLSPEERAAFLLRTVFDCEYAEIAEVVGKSEVHVRQIVSRARQRLLRDERRFRPAPREADGLAERFVAACRAGDVKQVEQVFTADAEVHSDGGGKVPAARVVICGPARAARFLAGVFSKRRRNCAMHPATVNNEPGGGVHVRGRRRPGRLRAHRGRRPGGLHDQQPGQVVPVGDGGGRVKPEENHQGDPTMKIVVIGGSGLIGKKLVAVLRQQGREAVAASPSSGVNAFTGEGVAAALAGADVAVDVSNSPSWADAEVMEFFDRSTRNLLAAEAAAGVKHHVALSVVGADRMTDSGYMRAKVNQEKVIQAGGTPYSIVRATQFFEFLGWIADDGGKGDTLRLSTAPMQPLAADDVAVALAEVAAGAPLNAVVELAGPEKMSIAAFVGRFLTASGDKRTVVADPQARYSGAVLDERGIAPGPNPRLGPTRFEDWFARTNAKS